MNYKILPNGLVQGGSAIYFLNAATGVIDYGSSIRVGKWFLSKTYKFNGTYHVDPSLLNPTNLTVGKVIKIGDLVMRVTSLSHGTALVSLFITGQSATGSAILSTSGSVVTLTSLDAVVTILGMQLSVGVRPS